MNGLERDPLFVALTRPQMFAGVTYSFFVLNAAVTTEAFLMTRSFLALPVALGLTGDIGPTLDALLPRLTPRAR